MERSTASQLPGADAARLSALGAIGAFSIGLTVLVGWATRVDALERFFFANGHMLPNTALGLVVAGVSLWLLRRPGERAGTSWQVARALALFVFVLGAVTLAERFFDVSAGIDELLFAERLREYPYRPFGRMATNSTVALTLAGGALLLLDGHTERVRRLALSFATIGLAIGSLALIGYLYGAHGFYQIDSAAGMATSTAFAFALLHGGILCARPERSWVGRLLIRGGGGMLARRLLLAMTLVPLALGWLYVHGRQESIVSRETGIAMVVVVMIAIQLTVMLHAAKALQAGERTQSDALVKEAAARGEAERANRAKNDFLAVMSHELRTPLNAIIGYGSLLRDGIPDPPTKGQQHQLERIGASAKHLLALIDEVLTLSRLELGEERVTPAHLEVASLVEDATSMMELEARKKGLALLTILPDEGASFVTDAGKLRQALLNLVGNAVKFTDRGEVVVRASVDPDGAEVVFEVEDTGLGIAPENLRKVFDAFWQVDQAPTRLVGGTGLGLHVTRRLVRLLGGEISVRSTLGKGSCFTIRLPRTWQGMTAEMKPALPPALQRTAV